MSWFEKIIEKVTHRRALETEISQLRQRLASVENDHAADARLAVVEADRTEIFARLNAIFEHLREIQDSQTSQQLEALTRECAACTASLETIRTQLERLTVTNERLSVLEDDRTELFTRLDELQKPQWFSDRLDVLEADRAELFLRQEKASQAIAVLESMKERLAIVEYDRTDLFERLDSMQMQLETFCTLIECQKSNADRIEVLENDRIDIYKRIDEIKKNLCETGIINLKSRIDSRIIRLEILWYYSTQQRRSVLNDEELSILSHLETQYDYGKNEGHTYPEDPYYSRLEPHEAAFPIGQDDGIWYADIDGKKVYLGVNRKDAESYLNETVHYLEGNTPHRYLDPSSDGIDIPEGSILLDIGAAEGYFGIRHIEKCKKAYFFEYDETWLKYLRKTCDPFGDKVEIVQGRVGDKDGDIHLDDFFRDREKPTFIKIDVEGAEGSVLRGMPELLNNTDPLTLLICTYHRQEDWNRYFEMLNDRFYIYSSKGYYWDMQDPSPPFFRHGIMRAVKKIPFM